MQNMTTSVFVPTTTNMDKEAGQGMKDAPCLHLCPLQSTQDPTLPLTFGDRKMIAGPLHRTHELAMILYLRGVMIPLAAHRQYVQIGGIDWVPRPTMLVLVGMVNPLVVGLLMNPGVHHHLRDQVECQFIVTTREPHQHRCMPGMRSEAECHTVTSPGILVIGMRALGFYLRRDMTRLMSRCTVTLVRLLTTFLFKGKGILVRPWT